ncbi:MAG TPA: LON peptidase substrate-binding domain-containing protein [Casimicrobiaceae bacterium]|nr:LON peptidase substrate-binding domain-containing protein [Casimicrobiaceae bacterium]
MLAGLFSHGRAASPTTIPLFPLRTVLFPGGVLPLKVFEQRYIDMTKACMKDGQPFGVVMITAGDEVATRGGTPAFAALGTLATITSWDMPELGILHLATEGLRRFRVRGHRVQSDRLVVADVVDIPDEPRVALPDDAQPLARLLELIATRVGPQNFPAEVDYGDATWVGYRLAEVLPLPLSIKQSMLEINDAQVRLQALGTFLKQQGLI